MPTTKINFVTKVVIVELSEQSADGRRVKWNS